VNIKSLEHLSEVKLNTLVAGNCFGEYSLLDGHYVSATVETLENTRILIIDKHDFQKIMDNVLFIAKTVYYNLARLYISRLRKSNFQQPGYLT
jgi:CRP-like cAMP-binding protein